MKDFNKMLNDNKDMPKIIEITDKKTIERYGKTMLVAPPKYYDEVIKKVSLGKLVTTSIIREYLAKEEGVDFTDPMTAGIFINIVAYASEDRKEDITPYWRVLKTGGELNSKFPGGIEKQKELLISEGFTIITKGRKNIKYYVKDYEKYLTKLN